MTVCTFFPIKFSSKVRCIVVGIVVLCLKGCLIIKRVFVAFLLFQGLPMPKPHKLIVIPIATVVFESDLH